MTIPSEYSFVRYLSAKKSVDDRALNAQVQSALRMQLAAAGHESPLQILEIGAGIGTMVKRLLARGLIRRGRYVAIDALASNMDAVVPSLAKWAAGHSIELETHEVAPRRARLHRSPDVDSPELDVELALEVADLYEFLARRAEQGRYDLLIAHAVLDLLDVRRTLPLLKQVLRPAGLLYLTINFDGATILQPTVDVNLDAEIERLYHRTMDERITDGRPSGDSQTGRHLFGHLHSTGIEIVAAGSSDWAVFANAHQNSPDLPPVYPDDEAYFLHFIVETMRGALNDHPELDGARFEEWIELRHRQIERGELVYVAHQIDFLARVP